MTSWLLSHGRPARNSYVFFHFINTRLMQSFDPADTHPHHNTVLPLLSNDNARFLELLHAAGMPPLESNTPEMARLIISNAQAMVPTDLSSVDVTELLITTRGFSIRLHVVKPAEADAVLPAFLFFHGGGWMLGDFNSHSRLVRDLVCESGAAAVFVNYSLSPEFRYPRAVEEGYAALQWLAANGKDFGVDSSRLAVVGNSAGANMATVIAMLAKERKGPAVRLQVLLWPNLGTDFTGATYEQFGKGYLLDTTLVSWFWQNYVAGRGDYNDYHVCPAVATTHQLEGLPPALIQVAGADVLRTEGENYGMMLEKAGVSVTTIRYNGVIHDFANWNALGNSAATRSLVLNTAAHLRYYLQ